MDLRPDKLRERFAVLSAERERILAVSEPIRKRRDAHVAAAGAKERELNAAIKAAEQGLFDIAQERALISRALGGKTSIQE